MSLKFIKITAVFILFFFTWTSGGLFSVAHAAVDATKKSASQTAPQKNEGAEEKLSRLTEELRETLADAKAEHGANKARLIAARAELDTHDIAIRAEFAATEQKLKDAKLPAEILARHAKFVKHYDDNLAELKGNIEQVEKARDDKEAAIAIEKTRQHLEKVKAPSRHQKLDPNNLPHRQLKVVKREPRLKKEDFDKDLKKDKQAWKSAKRIMVAANGSVSGLLPPDDLAETVEVQLTPEIKAKALELGNNPVRIYEFVRNNIEFVPTWGSIQGAQMTLLTKPGNSFDTSSLLIALLRAAGINARYVTGTITLPIDKVMNWAGGFTDPMAALDFMSSGGIPVTGITEGGKVTKARLETVYVEALINYFPSRGAKHINGKGDTWIPLDPSYKQYNYTQGIDIKAAVPFDAQGFLDQIKSTATINETQGYVTGIDSLLTQQTMQDYQTRVQNHIQQNYPNATVGDVLGKKEIVKKEYPYLLGTLPYRTAIKGAAFATIPDTLRHKLTFNVTKDSFDETPLSITKSLAELAGKKITLSYSPATQQDEAVINSYLPRPHADGTPIQPSELPQSLPAYLINVKPELRIDGQVVATGAPLTLGAIETFDMVFSSSAYSFEIVSNPIYAGAYDAIALNTGRIAQAQLLELKANLDANKAKLEAQNLTGLSRDDIIGNLLYATALTYYAQLDIMNSVQANTMGIAAYRLPSEAIFSSNISVNMFFGMPRSVSSGGLVMDVDRNITMTKALDGDVAKKAQYLMTTGMNSSALEHAVPELLFSTTTVPVDGISAIKALKIANDNGIPIYTVNQSNIANVLQQLQLDEQVIADIQNAVNAEKQVIVSKTDITYKGWKGCGYIISNPATGEGAYMIGGGFNGAQIKIDIDYFSPVDMAFTATGGKNMIFDKFIANEGDKFWKSIGKGLGVSAAAISLVQDVSGVYNSQGADAQKTAAYALMGAIFCLSAATAILAVATGGLAGFIIPIVISVLLNIIKMKILDYINTTRRSKRRQYYA